MQLNLLPQLKPPSLWVSLLMAFLARMAILYCFRDSLLTQFVEKSDLLAMNLAQGKGFLLNNPTPPDFLAHARPGYSVFLAIVYSLFGRNVWSIGISQSLLASANCLLTYQIGRRAYHETAGRWGTFFISIYPYMVYHDVHVNRTVLTTFLLLCSVYYCLATAQTKKTSHAFLLGCFLGASLLTEGPAFLATPLILLLLGWGWRKNLHAMASTLAAPILGIIFILAPWTARNYVRIHAWVPISTDGGRAFWKAHNEHSYEVIVKRKIATDHVAIDYPQPEWQKYMDRLTETQRDRLHYQKARAFIFQHPWITLKQMLYNALGFWHIRITPIHSDPFLSLTGGNPLLGHLREWSYTLSYGFLLIWALRGFHKSLLAKNQNLFFFLCFFAAGTLTAMMFSGITRYRIPFDPLLAILAGAGIGRQNHADT